MAKKETSSGQAADFRKQAEEIARKTEGLSQEKLEAMKLDEIKQTLHELQVHQIEVEMQNEELRLAGAELKALHERYFDLYDMAPVGYFTVNEKGLIIEANLTIATLLGITKSNLVKHPLSRFISREDQEIYYLHRNQLFETGQPQTCELRMVKKNKTTFWAYLEAIAAQDNQGKPACRVTISDMSTRKQSEEALRESEERFDQLAMQSRTITWELDGRGLYTYVSYVSETVLGYRPDELVGRMHFYDLHPESEREAFKKAAFAVFARKEEFVNMENAAQTKDGRQVWLSTNGIPLLNADGTLRGYRGNDTDITERKLADEALRESEELATNLIATMPDIMVRMTLTGEILFINDVGLRLTEYRAEEMIGQNIFSFIAPEDMDKAARNAVLMLERKLGPQEYHLIMKDGRKLMFEANTAVLHREDGSPYEQALICRDITDRKLAEESLRVSEQSYRNQFIGNSSVMLLIDPADGAILDANTAALGFYGYPQERLLAMRITDINTLPASEVRQAMTSITQEKGKRFEFQHRLADGSMRNVEVSSSSIQFGGRTVLHSIINDVTARIRAEEELRESEERINAITDSAHDAILMMDNNGNLLYWNSSAERILGYTSSETIGRNLHELIAPERFLPDHQAAFPAFQQTGRGNAIGKTLELAARRKDGHEIDVALSLSSVKIKGAWHAIGIVQDITDRKLAEEELQQAKALAETANKSKSEFLAGMSHEIRTPMNAIVGMADLLMESELTADQRIYVETSRNAGENLLELINGILDLSKVEAGLVVLENTEFDLASIMNKVCNLMSLKVKGKGIRIACAPLHNIPAILIGDPQRLMQIFINLVGNAMKFTKQGEIILGVETINGSLDSDDKKTVQLRFYVKDTGIGIPPDKVELIFEMFTQADSSTTRKYGGTGLGLHISKHFAELMGGRIWVASEVGKGSTFFFTATFGIGNKAKPLSKKTEIVPSAVVQPVAQRDLKILLVEDNDDNRLLLLYYLKKTPHHVDVAENGAIAVEKVATGKYDLVLMDVQMPVMDGYTATAEIRKLETTKGLKRTPVIALTANAMKEDEQKSREAGCDGHLTKPIRKDVLLEAIEKYGNTML